MKRSYASALMSSHGVGLGPSLKTQLKTIIFYNYTTAASGVFTGFLKTGSCYDPTGSFSTIQPAEFDQWSALFGRYVVLGGYVKVSAMTSAGSPQVIAMYPDISQTPKGTYQEAASQDWSKSGIMAGNVGGPDKVVLYQKFSHAALLGRKGPVSSDDNGGAVSGDPPANNYINHQIFIQNALASAVTGTLVIEIVQDVYFDQRITVDTQ